MFQKPPSWKMKIANLLLKGPTKYNNQKADFVFSYGGKITQIIQNIGVKPAQVIEIPTGNCRRMVTQTPRRLQIVNV